MTLRSLRRTVGGLVVAALVAVSCGGDDDGESSPDPSATETAGAALNDEPGADGAIENDTTEAEPGSAPGDQSGTTGDESAETGDALASEGSTPDDEGEDTAADAEATASDGDAPEVEGDAEPTEDIEEPEIAERELTISTSDGEQLTGTVFGSGEVGVVLAHMRGRDQTTWFDFARQSAAAGYQTLAFDFRGYGGSTGERDTALDVDLTAAVRALGDEGATQIIVMGASMGGTATVNIAGQMDLAGAVSISAPADFLGLDALDVAVNVGEPLLLIAAENDQPYADAAVGMDERAPSSQLILFEGNAHGTNLFGTHESELTNLLLSFVRDRAS